MDEIDVVEIPPVKMHFSMRMPVDILKNAVENLGTKRKEEYLRFKCMPDKFEFCSYESGCVHGYSRNPNNEMSFVEASGKEITEKMCFENVFSVKYLDYFVNIMSPIKKTIELSIQDDSPLYIMQPISPDWKILYLLSPSYPEGDHVSK